MKSLTTARHPFVVSWRRFMVVAVTALLFLCLGGTTNAQTIPDQQFNGFFMDLDNDKFAVRMRATEELIRLARAGRLSESQLGQIQTAAVQRKVNGQTISLEFNVRAKQVMNEFIMGLPAYRQITLSVGAKKEGVLDPTDILSTAPFTFDEATGKFRERTKLEAWRFVAHWGMVAEALGMGNVPAVKANLAAFKADITAVPENVINTLTLIDKNTRRRLAKTDIINKIDQAIGLVPAFEAQLRNKQVNPDPGAAAPIPVPGPGSVRLDGQPDPTGAVRAFRFDLPQVVSGGNVSLFSPDPLGALSLPPPGYEFTGEILDLRADSSLRVEDTIHLSIEYDESLLLNHPPSGLSTLRLVRIANGDVTFIETDNNLSNHILSGAYTVSSGDGLDQFGEFAVILAVPESSTGTLMLSALAAGILLLKSCGLPPGRIFSKIGVLLLGLVLHFQTRPPYVIG